MKKPFNTLTTPDVEQLRVKKLGTAANSFTYSFTEQDITNAVTHLETLYTGSVTRPFAIKILILNELY